MKLTYCEDEKGNQFVLTNNDRVKEGTYKKQIEFNAPNSEYEFILFGDIKEVKEKIKNILGNQ